MGKNNKSFRIRTNVNQDAVVQVDMNQTFEKFEILSLTLDQTNAYRLMASNTGIVAGRVLANGGFGVPNAKISVFVEYDGMDDMRQKLLYQFTTPQDTYGADIRYNLLPSESDNPCQQTVGTFPTKRIVLDNQDWIEVFDKYYKYTTKTNNAGDYMIYGVPVGMQQIHMDVDLSDIGILSQTPRDMMYKGYSANLFDSPTKFKKDTNLKSLVQIMTKDNSVYVYPFWGDTTNTTTNAAITRCDFNLDYKFEPTCIFMGSVITDTGENSLSKRCVAAKGQGKMSEMVTGEGRIEMIRKTYDGKVEQYSVLGDKVINENGIWCYQIPMNLDYITTDEFGNTVVSDNPEKGIPTRTRVRFRVNMADSPGDKIARKRARYLIPNNPHLCTGSDDSYPDFTSTKLIDYEFGSRTKNENFRDLMWNNVYTVKNYIPRLQKSRLPNNLRHLGIKMVNHSGDNNPMPFNNLRIKFNFTYMFLCTLFKVITTLVLFLNKIITAISYVFFKLAVGSIELANQWDLFKYIFGYGNAGKVCSSGQSSGFKKRQPRYWACAWGETGSGVPTPTQSWILKDYVQHYCGNRGSSETTCDCAGNGNDWQKQFIKGSNDDDDGNKNYNRGMATALVWLNMMCNYGTDGWKKWNFKTDTSNLGIGGLAAVCLVVVYSIGCGITLENICTTESGEEINLSPGVIDSLKDSLDGTVINGNLDNGEVREQFKVSCLICNVNVRKAYNCIENQLAQDNEVTSFNFYNDWVNGVLYFPLWYRRIKPERKILGVRWKAKDQYCANDNTLVPKGKYKKKMKLYSTMVPTRTVNQSTATNMGTIEPLADDSVYVTASHDSDTGLEILTFSSRNETNCYGYQCHKYSRSYQRINTGIIYEKETMLGDRVQYYKPVYYDQKGNKDTVTLYATDIVLLGSLDSCNQYGIPQFFKALSNTTYNMPPDLLLEDYDTSDDDVNSNETQDKETIDQTTLQSEFTGADWGDLGCDQGAKGKDYNTTLYDAGGLFYGLTCFNHYTKPKSCINLSRICELGISLDESQDVLKNGDDSNWDDDDINNRLTPDGFVSYDEIYDMDYRSMFATLNGNFLRTKYNPVTGRVEYDFDHLYVDNFDGSLYKIMSSTKTVIETQMGTVNNCSEHNGDQPNYANNYNLEKSSDAYLNFRYGNYVKVPGKKIYFYDKDINVGGKARVTSKDRQPRYENSFYFYFGLKDGKTALDKFNTEYFSDCVTESDAVPAYDVSFQGNSWCPGDSEDGYIAFNVHMDTPISVTLINRGTPEKIYYINNVTKEKFYIGSPENAPSGYSHYPWYDTQSISHLNECIPTAIYDINITDGNGNEYTDEITFEGARVNFVAESFSFTCKNNELITRFVAYDADDPNEVDWAQTYANIANRDSGHFVDDALVRDIGGYITVSDIDADITDFKIELRPIATTFFGDDYYGCSVKFYDGSVVESGVGYLGMLNGTYYFGVPYANQKYEVTITQLCDADEDSQNATTVVLTVREMLLKMFINGIDYDNIANFRTSWNESGVNYEHLDTMSASLNDGYYNNLYGWDNIENIGRYYYNSSSLPLEELHISDLLIPDGNNEYSLNIEKFQNIVTVLLYDYDGNGLPYNWDGTVVDCSTPYSWTENYCLDNNWWGEFIDRLTNIGAACDRNEGETTEHIGHLRRVIVIVDNEYDRTEYFNNSELAIIENINGELEYRPYYSDFEGVTTYELLQSIIIINNAISSRNTFVNQLQGAFRVMKDTVTQLTLTYNSNEPPIKYLIVGKKETENSTLDPNDPKFIVDTTLEENETVFSIATLNPVVAEGEIKYEPVIVNNIAKYPYYIAIKDNNNIALPSASVSDGIDNLNNEQQDYPNPIRVDKMFGVHFYNTPLYLDLVRLWHGVSNPAYFVFDTNEHAPIYWGYNANTQEYTVNVPQYVTLNGLAAGYCCNSLTNIPGLVQLNSTVVETSDQIEPEEGETDKKQLVYNNSFVHTYGQYEFDNRFIPTTEYQYFEPEVGNNTLSINDSYGTPYEINLDTNGIKFDETLFVNNHVVSQSSPSPSISDNLTIQFFQNESSHANIYVYCTDVTGANCLKYPLIDAIKEVSRYYYDTLPVIYQHETSLSGWENLVSTSLNVTTPVTINIGTFANATRCHFFVAAEYDGIKQRVLSPIFDTIGLRAIFTVHPNEPLVVYISERVPIDYTVTTNPTADIRKLSYLRDYLFKLQIMDGPTNVLYSQEIDMSAWTDTNYSPVSFVCVDTDSSNNQTSWNNNAIKVVISDNYFTMQDWYQIIITDAAGISKQCVKTTGSTIEDEEEGWRNFE